MKTYEIWNEKYRPQKFEDVIGIDPAITKMVNDGLPNFLFCGSPGTGKTTTARIIIKQVGADCLELNASDERGIDVIREKVKTFAMTRGTGGIKIVFLDEADYLTKEAQPMLRNLMETYHKNCRFILTCNYENKIIPALKSRCNVFIFKQPEKEEIKNRLVKIVFEEKAQNVSQEMIDKIVTKFYPDIRKCINKLQECVSNPNINLNEGLVVKDMIRLLREDKFEEARQIVLDSHIDPEDLLQETYDFLNKEAPPIVMRKTIMLIADCMKWMPQVIMKNILFEDFMIKLSEALRTK